MEHIETHFDHDNPIFNNYFVVLELNVNTNLSFVDPLQSEISNLDVQMLVTENIKYVEHNDFC